MEEYLKSKKIDINNLELLYSNVESVDWDRYQCTQVLIYKTPTKHNSVLLVRETYDPSYYEQTVEWSHQIVSLVKVK